MTRKKRESPSKKISIEIDYRRVSDMAFEAEQAAAKQLFFALEKFTKVTNLNKADGDIAISVMLLHTYTAARTPKAVEAAVAAAKRGTLNSLFTRTKTGETE